MGSTEFQILNEKLKELNRKLRSNKIVISDTDLSGEASCCAIFGVNNATGSIFYVDEDDNWQLIPSGGGGPYSLEETLGVGNSAENLITLLDNSSSNQIGTYKANGIVYEDGDAIQSLTPQLLGGYNSVLLLPKFSTAQNPSSDPRVLLQTINNQEADEFGNIDVSGAGAYIPLAGTESGSPVTGDIEFENDQRLEIRDDILTLVSGSDAGDHSYINPNIWSATAGPNNSELILHATGLEINTDIEMTNTTKGLILVSPDLQRWRITVNNAGALITTSI